MKNLKSTTTNYVSSFASISKFLVLGMLSTSIFLSCDVVGEIAGFEEPPFEDPTEIPRDNPVDPQNNAGNQYELVLQANVVSIITSGNILEGDEFRVDFVPEEGIPNELVAEIRYAIEHNSIPDYLPPVDFTNIAEISSIVIPALDEGSYTFTYAYRLQGFDETVGEPIQFTVDAIQGPGIYFFKKRTETVASGAAITFQVWLDEVEDVAGASIRVNQISNVNLIQNAVFSPYRDQRSVFNTDEDSGVLSVLTVSSANFEFFTMDVGLLDEQNSNRTLRSGPIGELTITTQNATGELTLQIQRNESILRNSINGDVPIGQTGSKTIIVQ